MRPYSANVLLLYARGCAKYDYCKLHDLCLTPARYTGIMRCEGMGDLFLQHRSRILVGDPVTQNSIIGESKTFENVSATVCNLGVRVIKLP